MIWVGLGLVWSGYLHCIAWHGMGGVFFFVFCAFIPFGRAAIGFVGQGMMSFTILIPTIIMIIIIIKSVDYNTLSFVYLSNSASTLHIMLSHVMFTLSLKLSETGV